MSDHEVFDKDRIAQRGMIILNGSHVKCEVIMKDDPPESNTPNKGNAK